MKAPLRRRRALSSVYGFIMIYLLVIASLQAISLSLSSGEGAEAAAAQAAQVGQARSLERLEVSLSSSGNVTVTNDGLITSVLSFLLEQGPAGSSALPADQSLAVGSTVVLDSGQPPPSSVAVVTTLGDVFASSPASPASSGSKVLEAGVGGPGVDAQLYMNPGDPTRFFMAEGDSAAAFSTSTGKQLWSFDAGEGEVTDVFPLSDGGVYVSDGYFGNQFTADLYRLSSAGTSLSEYSMRLFRLWTTVEVQFPNGGLPPTPQGYQPVDKGLDSLYAYYDGWFLSSGGISSTTVPSDAFDLATSDSDQFYVMQIITNPGGYGCTNPRGNIVEVTAYSADARGVIDQWTTDVFFNTCNLYPNELISSSTGSGAVALLFSQTYWSQPNYYGGPYQGANPFLVVLSSSGALLRSDTLDSSAYTSVATDGPSVYLSIPSADQVEVVGSSGSGTGTFYNVGFPASTLLYEDGSLFALSSSQVSIYSPSMTLEKTIDFSPQSFYSLSTSKPLESQMVSPSFLVLNSTSYAALLRNSTGFGTLVLGSY